MFQPHSHIFSVQKISLLALLTASCIVGRLFFVWIPNVQPMSAVLFLLALAGSLSDAFDRCFIEFAWYKYLFRDGALDDQPICSTGCYDYFFSSGRKNISHKSKAA